MKILQNSDYKDIRYKDSGAKNFDLSQFIMLPFVKLTDLDQESNFSVRWSLTEILNEKIVQIQESILHSPNTPSIIQYKTVRWLANHKLEWSQIAR